jgi:hypothetical protein
MNIAIQLPEDVVRVLEQKWGDLSQHTIQTLAVEGYRAGVLTAAQVRRMLGFQTRMEVDAFLKENRVYLDYTDADLDHDLATLDELRRQ